MLNVEIAREELDRSGLVFQKACNKNVQYELEDIVQIGQGDWSEFIWSGCAN